MKHSKLLLVLLLLTVASPLYAATGCLADEQEPLDERSSPPASQKELGTYLNLADQAPFLEIYGSDVRLDRNGIPTVKIVTVSKKKFQYNPVTVSQYGLQEYSFYVESGGKEHADNAVRVADWLLEKQDRSTGRWNYNFDYPVSGTDVTLKKPWASAMAQGQAISLLSRAYIHTSDRRYLEACELALRPLEKKVSEGGLTADLHGHPYYEEYPTTPPNYTLNGFMYTLIGLKDLIEVNPDTSAKALYEDGIDTLVYSLPFYDLGDTSAYNLGHLSDPPRKILTRQSYHSAHVLQLEELNSRTPDPVLKFYHDLWNSYVNRD